MSISRTLLHVAAVTITYDPDLELFACQCNALVDLGLILVFDNGSDLALRVELREYCSRFSNVRLIESEDNLGLAAGINHGMDILRKQYPKITTVLLMDQDSEPECGSVELLVDAHDALSMSGARVCVGPNMLDVDTGLVHGFHRIVGWRWKRDMQPLEATVPVPLANINGSGMLFGLDDFTALGGMDETFFIDHVDTDWSFRVLAAGGKLFGVPNAVFHHRMGEKGRRIWLGGWRVWPERSPFRHFYLFRNAVVLLRKRYVPFVWKVWAIPKLLLTFLIVVLTDSRRHTQCGMMCKGVAAGWTAVQSSSHNYRHVSQ